MNDFFNELGELALGSRLKRLSDRLYSDAQSVYKHYKLPIQPKWFSLLALLHSKRSISIVEASEKLGLSQPALSQFCKQLSEVGLIDIHKGDDDSRKRVMSLTKKGFVTISNMKQVWDGVERAAKELCAEFENNFYQSLVKFEEAQSRANLLSRTENYLNSLVTDQAIEFIPFSSHLAPFFEVINTQWIESMFTLEDIDKQVLQDPEEHIIKPGGQIWFAKHPIYGIVGTCALLKSAYQEYELTKMGVLPNAQGHKVGELLLKHVIDQALDSGCKRLYLLTNKDCKAAIHLYEKLGFVHSKEIMQEFGYHYERCNVAMVYSHN